MTSTEEIDLSLRGGLSKLGGKIGSLFNPALHPRGYHGRFTYTGGHDLKKAEASERKAARHEAHLERLAGRHHGGASRLGRVRSPVTRSGVRSPFRLGGRRRGGMFRGGHNLPGHGLGRLLGGHKKQQQPKGGGKGAGKGGGKGQQPKKGQQKQPRQQPKGQGKQQGSGKGQNGQKQAQAAAKKLQAAIAKAQKAQAANQKKQAAAALKAAKAAATAAQKLANAQQKARLAALKAQATAMMAAARGQKFTPSSHAMLYKGRNAVLKDVQAPAKGQGLPTAVQLAADSMAKASTQEPVGTKFLWHKPGFHLPSYVQHVANDLIEDGKSESEAIQIAIGIIKRWASGRPSGGEKKVLPSTVAAAQKALREWEELKAKAKSVKSVKGLANDGTVSGQVLDLTSPDSTLYEGTTFWVEGAVPVTPVASAADGARATQSSTQTPKQVTPNVKLDPLERPVEAITGARYRRYLAQGYTPASALARVAREAQQRQNEVGLAHQDGSVTVSSSGDGPRVTKSSTSKRPARAKPKRSWDTTSQRSKWAREGVAMSDGSFPIPSAAFVSKAARAIGRAPASKRPRVRAHIRKRAKALGVPSPV